MTKRSLILSMATGTKEYLRKHKYDYSTNDDYREMQVSLGEAQGSLDSLAGLITWFCNDALVLQRETFIFDGVNLELLEELRALIKYLDKQDTKCNYPGMALLKAKMNVLGGVTQERLDQRRAFDKKCRKDSRENVKKRLSREREFRRKDNKEQRMLNAKL